MLNIQGVTEVKYDPHQDYFTVRFESVLISIETIFATVVKAGKLLGREYVPEVIK
jgi:copper chaperone CopZ